MGHHVSDSETYGGDVADLRAFAAIVDLGSVTRAARALGETKGSVSRRLQRLERAVGAQLVRRSPRAVAPTEEGEEYRRRLGRALDLLDAATLELRHAGDRPRGHLRVTAPFDLSVQVLPAVVDEVTRRHPELTADVIMTEALLDFDRDGIDVALRAAPGLPDSSLVAHRLCDASAGLFAAPDYLARAGRPRAVRDLDGHPLLAIRGQRGRALLTLQHSASGRTERRELRAVVTATDFTFCHAMALRGSGIAVLPEPLAADHVESGDLVRVLGEWVVQPAELYVVYAAAELLPAKVRVFRDALLAAFGKKPPVPGRTAVAGAPGRSARET